MRKAISHTWSVLLTLFAMVWGRFQSPVVIKFGGTSLKDAESIRRACVIAQIRSCRTLVVSAPAGITNLLIECHRLAANRESFAVPWAEIRDRFSKIVHSLRIDLNITAHLEQIRHRISDGASHAWVSSRGEYLNRLIIGKYLGWDPVDSVEVMRFNTDGSFNERESHHLVRDRCWGASVVVGGFYGADESGRVHTFGRGGSDTTASHLAAALGMTHENRTDVDGVYDCDPRTNSSARRYESLTSVEYFALYDRTGARVVHPEAVRVADRHGVPIHVCSSLQPGLSGTWIMPMARRLRSAA